MPTEPDPLFKEGPAYRWIRSHMPPWLETQRSQGRWLHPVKFLARFTWKLVAAVADLLCRWAKHAAAEFWSARGYATVGILIAVYSFGYSLANEAYQRGELNASLQQSSFVGLVSGGSRPSFIAAVKGLSAVQNAASYQAPSFWDVTTWFVLDRPNRIFVLDWATAVFPECTNETCGEQKSRIDLRGANWDGVELGNIDLHDAALSGASMDLANLSLANFRGADLTGATLFRAQLMATTFEDATLTCANLQLAQAESWPGDDDEGPEYTSFNHADLRGIDAGGADFTNDNFDDADFSGMDGSVCQTEGGSDLEDTTMRSASFRRAKLRGADLQRADLQEADFDDADLTGADLRGANLDKALISRAHLNGAFYSPSTRWPQGFNAVAAGAKLSKDPLHPP